MKTEVPFIIKIDLFVLLGQVVSNSKHVYLALLLLCLLYLQVVAAVLPQEKEFVVNSDKSTRAVAALLPHTQPSEELRVEIFSSLPLDALQVLTTAVTATTFEGRMRIKLKHSFENYIACDECLQPLMRAK